MTYEEFLKLTKKNLKRFFPESFQERKVEIMEVLKNNNIKLQGVYQALKAIHPFRFYIWNPIIRNLRMERNWRMCGRKLLRIIRSARKQR